MQTSKNPNELVFVVKIDPLIEDDVAYHEAALWSGLAREFGPDRVQVWYEGRRVRYIPLPTGDYADHSLTQAV
jgi:hypothetical protein